MDLDKCGKAQTLNLAISTGEYEDRPTFPLAALSFGPHLEIPPLWTAQSSSISNQHGVSYRSVEADGVAQWGWIRQHGPSAHFETFIDPLPWLLLITCLLHSRELFQSNPTADWHISGANTLKGSEI
jgi:hypothetical protein